MDSLAKSAMKICNAKPVSSGMAIGPIRLLKKGKVAIKDTKIYDIKSEIEKFHAARDKSIEELGVIYEKALNTVAEEAEIFAVHQIMLQDDEFNESVETIIREEKKNAEYAVKKTGENFAKIFLSIDSEYMKERAADINDISERVIRNLSGNEDNSISLADEPFILFAEDLSPSETMELQKDKVLAFVTAKGSKNSHTAILARSIGIPALISVDIKAEEIENATIAAVDAFEGKLYLDPNMAMIKCIKDKIEAYNEEKNSLLKYKYLPTETKDGKKIKLLANIESSTDVHDALVNGAEGIGLFRSEFLYLEEDDFPPEDLQFNTYKEVLEKMEDKIVIIRTLDIGADKNVQYMNLGHEENPAMGLRGIRICLKKPKLFKTQIRALLRASLYGNLSVMFPMITSVSEIEQIYDLIEECMIELNKEGIAYKDFRRGIMIETPASALISDILSKKVDFFSIGTNDLTQYTMAIDRQNDELSDFLDIYHDSIIRLICFTVKNAKKAGIKVGICGELACDEKVLDIFLKIGVDELSMASTKILALRKHIRAI